MKQWLLLTLLGVSLLLLGSIQTVYHYVPELEEWNAYYIAHVSVPRDVVGDEVYLRLPLPDVNASDLNSIRVTIGSGSSERLLKSWVDYDDNELYVKLTIPSHRFGLRVYFGNPDAEPLSPEFNEARVYKAPPFDRDDYIIRYCEESGWHGIFRFIGSSRVYLAYWDDECGTMVLSREVPEGADVYLLLRAKGWGDASVRIFLSPTTSVEPDDDEWPDDYVEIRAVGDGYPRIRVVSDDEVVNEDTTCNFCLIAITLRYNGTSYDVYHGNAYLGTLPRGGSYLTFAVEKGYGFISLKRLEVGYRAVEADVTYEGPFPAPKAPSVEIVSPDDVVSESNVYVEVVASDPNGDLTSLKVYLDNNLLYDGDGNFSAYVELNDGAYILRAVAEDSEGAVATSSLRFVVDTSPPEVNVYVEQNDGNVVFDLNVSDLTDVTCTYSIDGEEHSFGCSSFTVPVEGCGVKTVEISVCDVAGNCYYEVYEVGEPCPVFGGGGGVRYVLKEKVVEKEVYVPVYKVSEGTREALQPASPLPVSGSVGWLLILALVVYVLMHF